MNLNENDLRRALDARSAPPSADFRGRLTSALAHGPRRADLRPVLAAVAAVTLAVAAVGVLVFARQASSPEVIPATKPSPAATSPSPFVTPTDSSGPIPGVVNPPPRAIALPADATLSAPSRNVIWALVVSQYLYRSTDQGGTWQQRPIPQNIGIAPEISFVSDTEGWLLVLSSPETQCNSQSVKIWHTTSAGDTWRLLPATGLADAQCKAALTFTDSMHGFLGAYDDNHRPIIYFTSDGGLTWKPSRPLSDPPGFTSQEAGGELTADRVHAFGNVLLVPVRGVQSASGFEFVFKSNDEGATWTYDATVANSGDSVAFVTATRWLQLIVPGESAETTDGGRTWHQSSSDYGQAAPIAPEVDFADGQVGYATVRGGIQLSVDGGQHWTYIKTPGT